MLLPAAITLLSLAGQVSALVPLFDYEALFGTIGRYWASQDIFSVPTPPQAVGLPLNLPPDTPAVIVSCYSTPECVVDQLFQETYTLAEVSSSYAQEEKPQREEHTNLSDSLTFTPRTQGNPSVPPVAGAAPSPSPGSGAGVCAPAPPGTQACHIESLLPDLECSSYVYQFAGCHGPFGHASTRRTMEFVGAWDHESCATAGEWWLRPTGDERVASFDVSCRRARKEGAGGEGGEGVLAKIDEMGGTRG